MAHAPLLRNNTAPVFQSSGIGGIPNTMNNAARASQLSGSTAYNSSSASLASLSSATTAVPPSNGNVVATTNIINQKADASRSLYQICVSLNQRLALVPGFESFLEQLDPTDPVESLWSLLRTGYPLLNIYNTLQPAEAIKVDDANANAAESKRSKIAVFKFVQACLKELNIPPAECFVINDVLGNDTTGFVKVCRLFTRILLHPRNCICQDWMVNILFTLLTTLPIGHSSC
jgi:cell division control protein 24